MQSATPSMRSSLILDQAVTISSLDNHAESMHVLSRRSESMQRNGPLSQSSILAVAIPG